MYEKDVPGAKAIFRRLLPLVWPIFIEVLLQTLVGNIDQMMIASYHQEAVGAIANANQVLNILMLAFSMVSMATTILVSQYRGAGDTKQLERIYTLSCLLNFSLSFVVGVILALAGETLFRFMNVPEVFMEPARQYISIVGSFLFLQALFMTFSAIFRSNQQFRTSMLVSVLINAVNVLGNALLIRGVGPIPALGVRGVAIATVLSRAAGLAVLVALFRRKIGNRIRLSCLKPFPKELMMKLIRIGVPAGGESASYNITQMIVLSFINGFGADATTARAYCEVVSNLALLYCVSVSQATQIVVGYEVGAGRYERADKTARVAAASSMGTTTLLSFCIFLSISSILRLFAATAEVVSLCRIIMGIEVFRQFGRSFNLLFIKSLQGAGDIRFAIAVGVAGQWLLVVSLGYVLGCVLELGLAGVWIAMMLDENIRGAVVFLRWKSGVWKQKKLVDN